MPKNKRYGNLPLLLALVVTSLSLGLFVAEGAAWDFDLKSVTINGTIPNGVTDVRLRENLTIEATWNFSIEHHEGVSWGVQFQLWNGDNVTIQASPMFEEFGEEDIARNWTFFLDPLQWTLEGQTELGQIRVYYYYYDKTEHKEDGTLFPIQVFPEQLDYNLVNFTFNNDSNDRMESLDLDVHFQSVQDPSFDHPGLEISCEVLNSSNGTIENKTYLINQDGCINVNVQKNHLIFLEERAIRLTNLFSNKLEDFEYFLPLSDLIERTDIISIYVRNKSKISHTGDSIIFPFNFSIYQPPPEAYFHPVYIKWKLMDLENEEKESGTLFSFIDETFNISLNEGYFGNLEGLKYEIYVEGNFILKRFEIEYLLIDLLECERSEVDIEWLNQEELLNGANAPPYGYNLEFGLVPLNHSIPFLDQTMDIEWTSMEENVSSIFSTALPDETGHFNISIPPSVLDRLESYELLLKARPSIDIQEKSYLMDMNASFPRYSTHLDIYYSGNRMNVNKADENRVYIKIYRDFNQTDVLENIPVQVMLLDGGLEIIESRTWFSNEFGEIVYVIPTGFIDGDEKISLHVQIHSTLEYQTSNASITIFIENNNGILDGAIIFSTVTAAAVAFAFALIFRQRYVKNKFLSKKNFTIKVTCE